MTAETLKSLKTLLPADHRTRPVAGARLRSSPFWCEWLCFKNSVRFARRHRRYALIGAVLYAQTFLRPRRAFVLRLGFCTLQVIDDLLDGDRLADAEPESIVRAALRLPDPAHSLVTQDALSKRDATTLEELQTLSDELHSRIAELELGCSAAQSPLASLSGVIEAMLFDRRRVRDRIVLASPELRKQHRRTFTHSLNLVLVVLGSREAFAPEHPLIDALGWCSTERDLVEDLEKGLVNVPAEVLQTAQIKLPSEKDLASPTVQEWRREAARQAHFHTQAAQAALPRLSDRLAQSVARLFIRSVEKYVRRREREWRSLPAC